MKIILQKAVEYSLPSMDATTTHEEGLHGLVNAGIDSLVDQDFNNII